MAIVVLGLAVAVAPVVWAPLVFESFFSDWSPVDLVAVAFELIPFCLLAGLVLGPLSRTTAVVTTVLAAAATVFFQYEGLDPGGRSTAPLVLFFGPVELALAILAVLGLDVGARALVRHLRPPGSRGRGRYAQQP